MFNSKMSNYPGGFASGVVIRGLPLHTAHPGKVYWVYNGTALLQGQRAGSNGNDGSFNAPFSTVDYAIGRCTANRGDIVMVKPGHSETFGAADGFDLDVAGVAVVGLGSGSNKPKFIFDTATTADMNISAANCSLINVVMEAGFADIVRAIQITAAYATVKNVDFTDQAADENWLTPIKATSTTDNNADGLWVEACTWLSPDIAGLEFIEVNADVRYAVIIDNYIVHEGTDSPLILAATGKDLKMAKIIGNFKSTKDTAAAIFLDIDTTGTNNSGIVAWNLMRHADVTTAHGLTAADNGFGFFENYSSSVNNLSGLLLPAADVDL